MAVNCTGAGTVDQTSCNGFVAVNFDIYIIILRPFPAVFCTPSLVAVFLHIDT